MNVKTKIILASLMLFIAGGSFAQTQTFSLQQAQEYAVKNAYSVKSAEFDLQAAKKKIWETTAIGLPQVSGTVQYQNIFDVPKMVIEGGKTKALYADSSQFGWPIDSGFDINKFFHDVTIPDQSFKLGVQENWTYTLTATQLIFSGEYLVGLQASRTFYQMSNQALQKSIRDIRDNVSRTYYLALVMDENYVIIKQNYELINKTLGDFKAMLQQGLIEETDVDQMLITKSTLENAMKNIESQKNITYKLLKFQMGISLDQQLVLSDSLTSIMDAQPALLSSGSGFSIDNNIDFQIMKTNVKAQNLLLKQQESKVLPSIAAVYRYQRLQNEPEFNVSPKNVLAIQMDIPIFASGSRYVKIQQAKINFEKTKLQLQQVEDALKLEVDQANAEYANALNSYNTTKENLALSKKIYDRTMVKYQTGTASSFDLNNAQNQYLTTLSNYYTSVVNLLNAKLHIEKLKN